MEDSPEFEDARHIDHRELREKLERQYEERGPGGRTVTINGQRYQLLTLEEYLSAPNQAAKRWEVFELVGLIDQRMRYEKLSARLWRAAIRLLNRLGGNFSLPAPPLYLKIPLGKIERRSR